MSDPVPVQVWLLIALAFFAIPSFLHIRDYFAYSTVRLDGSMRSKTPRWRTPPRLARSLSNLAAIVALALFIFTPSAEAIGRSPYFIAAITAGFGGWMLWEGRKAFITGKVEPTIRHFSLTYQRATQPKRYWASLIWNMMLGGFLLFFSFSVVRDGPARALEAECRNREDQATLEKMLAACTTLIDRKPSSPDDLADYVGSRGIAYDRLGDPRRAIADYDEAIRLDPSDFSTYYNRAYLQYQRGDLPSAMADYGTAIRLEPTDPDAYYQRGYLYAEIGDARRSVADLTQVIRLSPKSADAYFLRAEGYDRLGLKQQAESDLRQARLLDPT